VPGLSDVNGTGGVLVSGYNIVPYFAYLIPLVLAFGIAYSRSHRIAMGLLAAMVISYLEVAIGVAVGSVVLPAGVAASISLVFVAVSWYELHAKK
jgi:hypothetical protein